MIYLEADVWTPGKGKKNDPYVVAPVPQEQILSCWAHLSQFCFFAFDRFDISKP